MVYYTIYIKNLNTTTGYVDVCLEDDALLKDFLQYLDIGVRPHHAYPMVNTGVAGPNKGTFAVDLKDIAAITVVPPKR